MGKNDPAVVGQPQHVPGRGNLPGMGPHQMNPGVKLGAASHEHLKAHGAGNVRQFCQAHRIVNHQGRNAGHHLGAVDQGQPFARLQNQRRKADLLQGPGTAHALTLKKSLSHADQDQAEMGCRRQITAGAHRTLFRNHRRYAAIQKRHKMTEGLVGAGGVSHVKIVEPNGHDRTNHIFGQGISDTRGMAHENLLLQDARVCRGYRDIAQGAKACCDAVDHLFFPDPPGNETRRFFNTCFTFRGDADRNPATGDGHHVIDGYFFFVNNDRLHFLRFFLASTSWRSTER